MELSGSLPTASTYVKGGLPVALDSKRRTIRILPMMGNDGYTPTNNNIIRIQLPTSIGFLDTQNSYLRFRIKINNTNVDCTCPCFMDTNSMSWCDRFEVVSNNGQVLESIHDYNLLVNLLHKATSPDDYRLTTGKLLDNQGSRAERMGNLANNEGKMYCAGLDASGIFGGNSKYLPFQFLAGPLTLEFTLATFTDCFVGKGMNGGQGSYTISNVEYIAECLSFGQDFNYIFENQLRSSGIDISFHTYRSHHQSLQSANDQVIQLAQNSKSVKGCYVIMRDKATYRSEKHESLSTYKSGRLMEYYFDLGGRLFPENPISVVNNGNAVSFANNCNSFNHFRDQQSGSQITRNTFGVNEGGSKSLTVPSQSSAQSQDVSEVVARYHGWLIGNDAAINKSALNYDDSKGAADKVDAEESAVAAGSTDEFIMSDAVYFKPSNLFDMKDLKIGDRIKISYASSSAITDEVAFNKDANNVGGYNDANGYQEHGNKKGREGSYLFVVGVGLDVTRKKKGTHHYKHETIQGCVALAKTKDGIDSDNAFQGGSYLADKLRLTTTEVGLDNSFVYGAVNAVYLDVIADDKDFYIGQSFETHAEHDRIVSGSDMTSVVPLHINMKFSDVALGGNPHAPVKQGDLLTAFIHLDAILRIEPDGSVVSSN